MIGTQQGLQEAVQAAIGRPSAPRVQSIEVGGRKYWIKQVQERGLLLRLRKGPAATLLKDEHDNIRSMFDRALPVPEIALSGETYFATCDVGRPVDEILRDTGTSSHDRQQLLEQVAHAVAALHSKSAAHGGLHLRNICLGDTGLSFIDLEKSVPQNATLSDMAYDLRVLVFSVFAVLPGSHSLARHVLSVYRQTAPPGIADLARDWCRSHWWLKHLAAPLRWHEDRFRPDRTYRQYGAVAPALAVLGDQNA